MLYVTVMLLLELKNAPGPFLFVLFASSIRVEDAFMFAVSIYILL